MDKKVLTAYFSYEGHTRKIAEKICRITGGDLFEIRPAQAYCTDYNKTERQARQEVRNGFRPVLAQKPQDMTQYDIVFVGTPNWFNKVAPAVASFLAGNDFSGKTVVPFCTHGGNGVSRVVTDLRGYIPNVHVAECLDIFGDGGPEADGKIRKWIEKNI
jgi:putative flavodoxin